MKDTSKADSAMKQHAREIAETRECWDRKPLLRSAYRRFHEEIRRRLAPGPGLTVELGSGIGMIKETIPDCITTDLFPNPWVDQREDAYALSFADGTVSNLILFDVWHHLEYPGSAMAEFARVLAPKGRVILFEPAALSLLGRVVFGLFHHEPIHSPQPEAWFLPPNAQRDSLPYYAAQGNAWKMFRKGNVPPPLTADWRCFETAFFPAFDWLAAGGFRQRQFLPSRLAPLLRLASACVSPAPSLFSTRMLVRLEPVGM
jgi:SAM-dependent methyltransferase